MMSLDHVPDSLDEACRCRLFDEVPCKRLERISGHRQQKPDCFQVSVLSLRLKFFTRVLGSAREGQMRLFNCPVKLARECGLSDPPEVRRVEIGKCELPVSTRPFQRR